MNDEKQPVDSLSAVKDIRQMMERSSRFISLSGMSGIAAGVCALAGAAVVRYVIFENDYDRYGGKNYFNGEDFAGLKFKLIGVALIVFAAAFISAYYFTWRKSNKQGVAIWNPASRRLFWSMAFPLVAGGLFILGMLRHDEWRFIAPSCLLFYGLALVNASKYTLSDIRYLGYCEVALGLINMLWIGYGLYFWAIGFGIMHIVYGLVMYWKYERND